jgi:hypothetical protein
MTVETLANGKVGYTEMLNSVLITPEDIEAEQAAGALAKQWQIRNLTHAYQPRDPLKFLVDGLLPCPCLGIVYGGPGSLKSMLLADMAVCIASGHKWLEAMPSEDNPGITFRTEQNPVLWIDFDNGTRRTDERIDAFAKTRELPVDTPLHYVSMPTPWLDASLRPMIEELAKLVKHLKAKLIIVDNLGLVTGDVEENSGGMSQVMGNLRWLCEETEAAVIVVHHQRKSGGAGDAGIRKGETLRGHSSIEAALDLALLVERKNGEDSVAVIPTKVRGYKIIDIFGAYFTYTHKLGTYDLESARFFSRATESETEKEIRIIKTFIRSVLEDARSPLKQGDIVERVRDSLAAQGLSVPGINKVRGVLSDMGHNGELQEFQGEKGKSNRAVFYELPRDHARF